MNARQRRAARRHCPHRNRVESFGFPDAGFRPLPHDVTVGGRTVPAGTLVHMTGSRYGAYDYCADCGLELLYVPDDSSDAATPAVPEMTP